MMSDAMFDWAVEHKDDCSDLYKLIIGWSFEISAGINVCSVIYVYDLLIANGYYTRR